MDYALDAGEISLFGVATQEPDIKTIFKNQQFTIDVAVEWAVLDAPVTSSNTIFWESFINGVSVGTGNVTLDSRQLPTSISTATTSFSGSGLTTISTTLTLDDTTIEASRVYQSMAPGASIVPLLVILGLAVTTHMVELSLGLGVFVGACMITGTIIDGFKETLERYILGALSNVNHGYVYLFTLFLSGLVSMIEKSGGLLGLAHSISKYATTSRSAQAATFITGCLIFFDDYANCLIAGSTMRRLNDSLGVSRQKLAFIVDATAAPIASLIPISSWVGFEVGLIQEELNRIVLLEGTENLSIDTSGFAVFLQSIKYRYYPIFMLMLIPLMIYFKRDYGPMLKAERLTFVYGRTDGGDGAFAGAKLVGDGNDPNPDTPQKWWNMAIPIVMLVVYIFYLLVKTGDDGSGEQAFIDKIEGSDSYVALLWGTMAGVLTAQLLYMIQFKYEGNIVLPFSRTLFSSPGATLKGALVGLIKNDTEEETYPHVILTVREGVDSFLHGLAKIFPALVVLTLAWSAGAMMTDVGAGRLFSDLIVNSGLPYTSLPSLSFIISLFMALATGSSWATMTIMFPLILVPTYVASNGDPIIFYATTAGILSGSVAGDHMSPISDTTVLSAMASECDLMAHVSTQIVYALTIVLISVLCGTVPVGREAYPNGVGILLGLVGVLVVVFGLGVPVVSKTGRWPIFMSLYLRFRPDPEMAQISEDTIKYFNGEMPEAYSKGKLDHESEEDSDPVGDDPEKEIEMADDSGVADDSVMDYLEEESPLTKKEDSVMDSQVSNVSVEA
jgi:Na+/H+ antiporter NhaC